MGPVSEATYRDHFVDPERWSLLTRLVREYLVEPLAVELEVKVLHADSGTRLGRSWHRLGQTSYLGEPGEDGTTAVRMELDWPDPAGLPGPASAA